MAIVISEMMGRIYKRIVQSVIFLPYFISWVIVGTFVLNLFNYETGVMNNLIRSFGGEPINLYTSEMAWVWVIIICAFNSWKWVGYNSIIYIAAITSLDAECYEAATIEGANVFQKIWYITFPSIKPDRHDAAPCRSAAFSAAILKCSTRSSVQTDSSTTRRTSSTPMCSARC